MDKNTSWGQVAGWYDEMLEKEGTYQKEVILPHVLRLVAPKPGAIIADIASGQGFFARAFAQKGATVLASDIAPELIAVARNQPSNNITYTVTPAHNQKAIPSASCDIITIILAIQNIENIKDVFVECKRILKPGGKLLLVVNHPSFRIPKASDWSYDAQQNIEYRRIAQYLTESKIKIDMHPGKQTNEYTISFHRPLQLYVKQLAKAGFCITRLEEWETHKKSTPGPRAKAEDRAKKEIPLFLMIEAAVL